MANIKISELTALTPPAAADELAVVDVSATSTKKTTVGEVVGIINGDVEVANDGTATISELPVSKLQDGAARQVLQTDAAGAGVEWTSDIDVPGTLDVAGAATFDSSVAVTGTLTKSGSNVVTVGDTGTVTSTMILNGTIVDGDVNASAAIAGAKISPDFGSQNIITTGTATAAALVPSGSSVPTNGVYLPSANNVAISTNGTERARIDSSGRLLVGTSTARAVDWWGTPRQQFEGLSYEQAGLLLYTNSTDIYGSVLSLGKSRGTSIGSNTVLQSGDEFGNISFYGSDGTNEIRGAQISALVDGTPGANDMPGRLVFSVTQDGSASPTEAMRIKNSRIINFANAPTYADNTAALAGGLVAGDVYRKSDGTLMITY